MEKPSASRKYTGQVVRPKKSILRRWSSANALFFFIAFLFFAITIYMITDNSFIGGEKGTMVSVMDRVEEELKVSDQALTSHNLEQYFNYNPTMNAGTQAKTIEMSSLVTQMIGSKNQFFVYDTSRQLIFSTAGTNFPFFENTEGVVRTVTVRNYTGYLESRPVISAKTGKTIGYIQSFYNLGPYYQIRNRLILSLIGVAVLAIVAALIFSFTMADHFLHPLRRISRSMEAVAANPEEVFEPVIIQTDDEIKQIGDFYNEMMARLTMNLDLQRRFVSDVSHELRTPIAVIDGNLKMLMRWGKDDPEVLAETLEISHHEAEKMVALIKDMLDLSRLEQLPESKRIEKCDVSKVGQNVVRNFQLIHANFKISFENKLMADEFAQISENHYAQALTILMDNAVKYSPDAAKDIKLTLDSDKDFIITQVRDHGIGISKKDAAHVFERFFRVDQARNREIGGTGLGLSIISNLLKVYQGEILLDSEPGKGSTFTLKLPKVAR